MDVWTGVCGARRGGSRNRVTVLQKRLKNKVGAWRVDGGREGGGRVGGCRVGD